MHNVSKVKLCAICTMLFKAVQLLREAGLKYKEVISLAISIIRRTVSTSTTRVTTKDDWFVMSLWPPTTSVDFFCCVLQIDVLFALSKHIFNIERLTTRRDIILSIRIACDCS